MPSRLRPEALKPWPYGFGPHLAPNTQHPSTYCEQTPLRSDSRVRWSIAHRILPRTRLWARPWAPSQDAESARS